MVAFPFINWNNGIIQQCIAATAASFGMVMVGSGFTWVSGAVLDINLSDDAVGWLIAISPAMASISLLPCRHLSNVLGRRALLQLGALINMTAYIIIGVLPFDPSLFVARALKGIGTSAIYSSLSLYLSEVVSPSIRVPMSYVTVSLYYMGTVYSAATGPYLSIKMYSIASTIPAIVYAGIILAIPESPEYYASRGREAKALEALSWLRGGLEAARREYDLGEKPTTWKTAPAKAMSVTATVTILHASAAPAVMAFTPMILEEVLDDKRLIGALQVAQAVCCWLAAACSFSLLEECKRRSLLLGGCVAGAVFSIAAGILLMVPKLCFLLNISKAFSNSTVDSSSYFYPCTSSYIHDADAWTNYTTKADLGSDTYEILSMWLLPVAAFTALIYPVISALTFYPLSYTLVHEVFEPRTHSDVSLFQTLLSLAVTAISCKIFQVNLTNFGSFVNFYINAIICIVGGIILYAYLPETRDKRLVDIIELFKK